MLTRPLHHLRRNAIPYLALLLVLAVGAGGGYALAATKTKTITVCADKKTGILHLKAHGRCAADADARDLEPTGTARPSRTAGSRRAARGAGSCSLGARTCVRRGIRRSGCLHPACIGWHLSADDHGSGVRARTERAGCHRR